MATSRLLACGAAAVLLLSLATPALAATTGATTATVTISGGSLSITVPTGTADLGTHPDTIGGEVISGPLGSVSVTDARDPAAGSGWVASVIASAFTPPAGPAIPASDVSYTAGAITKTGTATYTADDPTDLTGVSPAVTATGITGDNSATWTPTINVHIPEGMAANTYTSTITHSVT